MPGQGGLLNYLHKKKLAAQQGLPAPAPHQMMAQPGAHPPQNMSAPHPMTPAPGGFSHNPVPAAAPIAPSLPHPTTAPAISALDPGMKRGLSPSPAIKLPKLKKMMNLPQ